MIDGDVASYFDTIGPTRLRDFLARRITDGVIRRMIHPWLKAGGMDNGFCQYPKTGVPRGGVISPRLPNRFRYPVCDMLMTEALQPRVGSRSACALLLLSGP